MKVIKRNGSETTFCEQKIANAIMKANHACKTRELSDRQIKEIVDYISYKCDKLNRAVSVEEIQDMVETELMNHGARDVARCYIKYRYERSLARKANTTDARILSIIDCENEEIKQENSNKNPTIISVQRDYMAGEVSKDLVRRFLFPENLMQAHDDGEIHIHDTDYISGRIHNCFHKNTKFLTTEGIKSFADFSDGQIVEVFDKNGIIRKATVRKYGKQNMYNVVFKTTQREKTVVCTKNHRWILKDGTVTTELKVGDSLLGISYTEIGLNNITRRQAEMFSIGFLIGDGCDHIGSNLHQIRLCGHKTKYKDILKQAGYIIKNINNSEDLIVTKKGYLKQDFLNNKSWKYLSSEDKKYLFYGLYCADGSTSSNKLCTTDERVAEMVRDTSYFAGYYISSENIEIRDTKFKKNSSLLAFHFVLNQPNNLLWKVESIKPYKRNTTEEYDAWCIEEPVTHSFMLDGGMITGNCDLVNLEDMLQNGTVISEVLIEKPHRISTACNIASQIVAQVASSQFGGQSISLTHLAPFVDISRKEIREELEKELKETNITNITKEQKEIIVEKRLKTEVKNGIQTFNYQLVTLMTTNGQTPFVTVFMYLNEAKNEQEKKDLALLIEEMLHQRIKGLKNEKGVWITPAFPKLIYVLDEDNIKEGTPYFYLTELAAKCTAKRMVPDYISAKKMRELKKGNVYTCMGCRSFLTAEENVLNPDGSMKFYGRFNQGVVTINLVDVALSSGKDMKKFWKILEDRLELCHEALRLRHERLVGTPSDVAPILWQHGALARLKKGEVIDNLLYNGYSTISLGYAGLYEMCYYMTGKSHTNKDAKEFALSVMQKLNDKCTEWKQQENISYSVYGTPIESTTYKFEKNLQRKFGIIEGVTDHNYITNSYHVNVRENIDAFTKLAFESEFQELSPGGAISYVEVPNMQQNIPAIISVLQFIYDNIMYAELNTKSDYCMNCGFDGEIQIIEEDGKLDWECPNCGNRNHDTLSVARRTCGYIGSQFWNQGRTQEIKDRVLHL